MRNNLDYVRSRGMHQQANSYGHVTLALTGVFVIPADGPQHNYFNPNGSDRTIYLPTLRDSGGQQAWVTNLATATYVLFVVDANGTAVGTVFPGRTMVFNSNFISWYPFEASIGAVELVTDVTTASYTALLADEYIRVNYAGAVSIQLASAASRNGRRLRILDASGRVGTDGYPITILRAGSDTLLGATSLEILSDFGTWELKPVTGKWDVLP